MSNRFKELFKELIKDEAIVVYGAGQRGNVVTRTLNYLGVECLAVIDRDVDRQGEALNNILIIGLNDVEKITKKFSIIVSVANGTSIVEELSTKYRVLSIDIADYIIRLSYLCCEDYGYDSIVGIDHFCSPYPNAFIENKNLPIMDIDFNWYEQEKNYKFF